MLFFESKRMGMLWTDQREPIIKYDEGYYFKTFSKGQSEIAQSILRIRYDLVKDYLYSEGLLDYGCGNRIFLDYVRSQFPGCRLAGYDICRKTVENLRELYYDVETAFMFPQTIVTFWDSFEHLPNPEAILRKVRHACAFAVPIFSTLECAQRSKHWRPGEHLWYWTDIGFRRFIEAQGFELVKATALETMAGRDEIMSYLFERRV